MSKVASLSSIQDGATVRDADPQHLWFLLLPGPRRICRAPRSHIYLPQVKVEAHTSIISSIARTTLFQTFANPGRNSIKQLHYTFPLFDGVSIVEFTCTVGDRVIKGVVKERNQAKATFDHAVAQGETAGLLEQAVETAGDVFRTSVGNIPGGAQIKVEITYLGELKHDAQTNGLRLTIPTCIAPRYGSNSSGPQPPNAIPATPDGGIHITVDAQVSAGSRITSIQSPSHKIAVTIGKTSKSPEQQDLTFEKASATLSLNTTELYKDFVLQMSATEIENPVAILEEHPSIPGQKAIMATLVPKFSLAPEKPEVVFVCDRSGSMGDKIPDLKKALQLFVKSLTVGVKFNICSFGSNHSFLWNRSRTYDSASMGDSMQHIEGFGANYGGTEIYQPIEQTIKRRYQDMNLEVFLLTDGEIWDQDRLVHMINENVASAEGAIRIFTLGIGHAASHSLIERVARAGNGFSQAVAESEEMGSKVVRMLKGALSPHIKDYTLEVKYDADDHEDFEVIDTPSASLVINDPKADEEPASQKPISLFDPSNNEGDHAATVDEDKYSGLPSINAPKLLQAPNSIPPLFPFTRSTVYLMISPDAGTHRHPKSVILRGTSRQGPLELEIPITHLGEKGQSIHQLAAKKAVGELEEGRGWIFHAKDAEGVLLKQKYDGKFQDMVEREAVRLGVQYQVGGKWCSFIAVSDGEGEEEIKVSPGQQHDQQQDQRLSVPHTRSGRVSTPCSRSAFKTQSAPQGGHFGAVGPAPMPHCAPQGRTYQSSGSAFGGLSNSVFASQPAYVPPRGSPSNFGGSLFGSAASPSGGQHHQMSLSGSATRHSNPSANQFSAPTHHAAPSGGGLFGGVAPYPSAVAPQSGGGLFGSAASSYKYSAPHYPGTSGQGYNGVSPPAPTSPNFGNTSSQMQVRLFPEQPRARSARKSVVSGSFDDIFDDDESSKDVEQPAPTLSRLVVLQSFDGSWAWTPELFSVMQWDEMSLNPKWTAAVTSKYSENAGGDLSHSQVIVTACVVAWLRKEASGEKDSWELLVDKALAWLESQLPGQDIEGLVEMAKALV
ncbi:von willebrand domain containing protein [Apiospora sp. TS-2023a]